MSRKLDVAIARGLGYTVIERTKFTMFTPKSKRRLPEFSTRGNYMLELCSEMQLRGYNLTVDNLRQGKWKATYFKPNCGVHVAVADTMPMAVALAAHKALTWKKII